MVASAGKPMRNKRSGFSVMFSENCGSLVRLQVVVKWRLDPFMTPSSPDVVYRTGIGGGAMILDKFPRAEEDAPVPLRSTRASSSTEATATTQEKAKPGQRRPVASEVKCVA